MKNYQTSTTFLDSQELGGIAPMPPSITPLFYADVYR